MEATQNVTQAASLGCKQLLSEDLNHGQVYGGVQVINPFKIRPKG